MAPRKLPAPEILETEWDILDVLWTVERATAREVTEHLAVRREWAYSTVKTLLDRMVDKQLVVARQVGNVWEYTPGLPRQKAQRAAWRRLVDVAFGGRRRVHLGVRRQGDQAERRRSGRAAGAAGEAGQRGGGS